VTGTIEAADHRSAVSSLSAKGQFVVELAEESIASEGTAESESKSEIDVKSMLQFGSGRIKSKDILAFTNQLTAALRAGLPLLNGLEIIRDQQHKPVMKKLIGDLAAAVRSGQSFSEALAERGDIFRPLYVSMVRVGETGGMLDSTMGQVIGLLERDEKIKTSLKNASAYPIFVLSVGMISVIIILVWVLPKIMGIIGTEVAVLPWPTRMLLSISRFLKMYGWLTGIALAAGIFYFRKWARGKGRLQWDTFKLRIPVMGTVLRTIAVGRLARTLGSLTKGGVTILESLGVVRDTLGNELLGREIDNAAEKVKSGSSLAGPLEVSGYFPPLLVQIISIGEQTGQIDSLLLNAAETFDEEADSAINSFLAIFPAILILILAMIIGFIILSVLMPLVMMQLGSGVL
jgi:type II secretory pathway component PulF